MRIIRPAKAGSQEFYDAAGVEIENGPVLSGLKGEGQGQHPVPTGTEPSPQTVAALAAAVNVPLEQEGEAGPRFSIADEGDEQFEQDAQAKWAAPDSSWLDDVLYQLQDKHVDTLRVQQAIERAGQRIDDDQNVRQAEELYHGRVARRLQEFMREEVQPLLALMQRHRL